jgi:hypothetical protein
MTKSCAHLDFSTQELLRIVEDKYCRSVQRSFIEPIPERTYSFETGRSEYRAKSMLRMTTIRTCEYMREYRSRKDSTYRHIFVDLAAETLRQPGQSKFSRPLTDPSRVRRTLRIRSSFYQPLYHMLTPDRYMRNDPPLRTTFFEPRNMELLIQNQYSG